MEGQWCPFHGIGIYNILPWFVKNPQGKVPKAGSWESEAIEYLNSAQVPVPFETISSKFYVEGLSIEERLHRMNTLYKVHTLIVQLGCPLSPDPAIYIDTEIERLRGMAKTGFFEKLLDR